MTHDLAVYSNTLMTSLNSRASKLFSPRGTNTTSGFRSRHTQSTSHQFTSTTGAGPLAIQITHEVESDRDVADNKTRQVRNHMSKSMQGGRS